MKPHHRKQYANLVQQVNDLIALSKDPPPGADSDARWARARDLDFKLEKIAEAHGMTREQVDDVMMHYDALFYINAYAIQRNYGGPEEGGWWWDSGEPIASVPMRANSSDEEVEKEKARITELIGWENKHNRFSVLGGEDFQILIEDHPAKSWPDERPHYE